MGAQVPVQVRNAYPQDGNMRISMSGTPPPPLAVIRWRLSTQRRHAKMRMFFAPPSHLCHTSHGLVVWVLCQPMCLRSNVLENRGLQVVAQIYAVIIFVDPRAHMQQMYKGLACKPINVLWRRVAVALLYCSW